MYFQEVDVRPNFEFGYWDETLVAWQRQGLPEWVVDEASAYTYFGIENWVKIDVDPNPLPLYEHMVLRETDDHIIYRDEYGCIARNNKRVDRTIPHYLEYPVKDALSWFPFEHALDPSAPRRWERFEESLESCRASEAPIGVAGGSLIGIARNLMGFEGMATLPLEDPRLFHRIVDTFGATIVAVLERILPRIQVDFCLGWEDICFNHGPLISPDMYRATAGPWMRRIADLLTAHGCCVYGTDTDGNINAIVDVMLENGMNTMFPVEVHAGTDPCALRDRYGKRIRLWGGVDKRKMSVGRESIDTELTRLRPYVEQGGFIPGFDHRVPADMPLDLYKVYLDRTRAILGVGGEPRY
jgi:uroporphyrinogen decarboxylase